MALFKRGGKGPDDPMPVRVDVSWGDPVGRRIRLAARSNDGDTVLALLEGAEDAHEREFLLQAAVHGVDRAAWADRLPDLYQERPSAWLVRGASAISRAWMVRGGPDNPAVSEDAEAKSRDLFEAAERDLVHATRIGGDDPTAWGLLTVTSTALRLGFQTTCDRFDEADQHVPWLHLAHHHMLRATFARNGGSDDMMFAFARDVAARAPRGAACHDVVPLAHLERWRHEQAEDPTVTLSDYLNRPPVAAEWQQAFERSAGSASFDDRRAGVLTRNVFALVLLESGDQARAADQLLRIGERASEEPWNRFAPDPGLAFARARQRAGLSLDDDARELV